MSAPETATPPPEPQRVAASRHGMIATQHYEATRAGVEALRAGGNAIDAAVAAAFALCVCEPAASGLGGQTMMLIHTASPRRTMALDGSSRAPSRAGIESFAEHGVRLYGHRATTVPSTPAVLDYALRTHGKLSVAQVLGPAIRLAEDGYVITALQHRLQGREPDRWREGNAAELFLKDGAPYPVGDTFRQPALAGTLQRLAENGIEEFYQGEIAAQIEADMLAHGGYLRRDDLAHIPHPIERRPVSCRFAGMRVLTFPPPGAGRTVVEMLNVLEHCDPADYDPDTVRGACLLAEVIRRAQLDRQDRPFDPSFYPQVQDKRMVSPEYAKLAAQQIKSRLRGTSGETTHLSVMDGEGNVVALTQSIERVYGSLAACPDLGFLYNNYMSAFDYKDITHPYYLRPNRVPWASVAPTIVFRGRRPYVAIGSPGSERIASSIVQVLVRLPNQSPLDAITAPRLHCSLLGKLSLEAPRIRTDVQRALRRRGFELDRREAFSFYLGCVQLVMREGRMFVGAADPRRDGSAGGPSTPRALEEGERAEEPEIEAD